jgi:kinesin family member 11
MEGNLIDPESKDSGIIPRALNALFNTLEKDNCEYSVRVSFTELYNEDLMDLLSADNDNRKLKLFEDLQRKGSVVIQGLVSNLISSLLAWQ